MKTETLTNKQRQILLSITEKQEQWILLSLAFIEKYDSVRPSTVGVHMGRRKDIASAPVSAALKKALLLNIVERTPTGIYYKGEENYEPKFTHDTEFYTKLKEVSTTHHLESKDS